MKILSRKRPENMQQSHLKTPHHYAVYDPPRRKKWHTQSSVSAKHKSKQTPKSDAKSSPNQTNCVNAGNAYENGQTNETGTSFFCKEKRKKQRFLLLKEQFVRHNGDHQGRTL
jgi:hypothetical protein